MKEKKKKKVCVAWGCFFFSLCLFFICVCFSVLFVGFNFFFSSIGGAF